ncbi:hypothetical protein Y032_0112g294 [Ancylostoma ceylanicum]|uniref:Uncharacterized protein n=1 Tax=Ancylostoma ceylanicum TaxID=53326 RepID=A0A016TDW6_9BILA|nr:hypothetical protein Y032_0112g294 [Ancylostoma ceylanicum]
MAGNIVLSAIVFAILGRNHVEGEEFVQKKACTYEPLSTHLVLDTMYHIFTLPARKLRTTSDVLLSWCSFALDNRPYENWHGLTLESFSRFLREQNLHEMLTADNSNARHLHTLFLGSATTAAATTAAATTAAATTAAATTAAATTAAGTTAAATTAAGTTAAATTAAATTAAGGDAATTAAEGPAATTTAAATRKPWPTGTTAAGTTAAGTTAAGTTAAGGGAATTAAGGPAATTTAAATRKPWPSELPYD